MSDDLVERLRHAAMFGGHYAEAADRIEALELLKAITIALQRQVSELKSELMDLRRGYAKSDELIEELKEELYECKNRRD